MGRVVKKTRVVKIYCKKIFFSTRAKDNTTPTIPTLMPIIRRKNTVLQLFNMVGVTRVGRVLFRKFYFRLLRGSFEYGIISLNAQILLKSFRKEFENSTSRGTSYNDGRCVQRYGISFCFSFPPRAESFSLLRLGRLVCELCNGHCCYATTIINQIAVAQINLATAI